MNVPIPDEGVAKGSFVSQEDLDLLLDDYYEVRGWTKEGIPTVEKLKEIGMDDLVYIVKDNLEPKPSKRKEKGGIKIDGSSKSGKRKMENGLL
jgi:hypothetical protein